MATLLANFPQWELLRKQIAEDDLCGEHYVMLVQHHEELAQNHKDLIIRREELKEAMYTDFKTALARFPYYISFWKSYAALVERLDGVKARIEVLARSVSVFPYSLDLWKDYTTLLVERRLHTNEEIKEIFARGAKLVGGHFLSHDFWDSYLSFVLEIDGKNSNDYINVLLEIVKLPLHQYSRYYESFMERVPNFPIEDLIPEVVLKHFLNERFGGNKEVENDSTEIIDAYFSENFLKVQKITNEKWVFESKLTKTDFDFNVLTPDDIKPWLEYIEYERARNDMESGVLLFERAVVPTCFLKDVWIEYARFLIHQKADNSTITKVFNRACDLFVPHDVLDLRYMFAKYHELERKDIPAAKQVLLSCISKNRTNCDPVSQYITLLFKYAQDTNGLLTALLMVVDLFERENASASDNKRRKGKEIQQKIEINNDDVTELQSLLSYKTVGQLITSVVKYQWIISENIEAARKTLERFFKYECVKCNKEYWFTYYKLTATLGEKQSLTNMINYIKVKSQLGITDLNLLLNSYKIFMFKNCKIDELTKNKREYRRIFLETDIESSTHERHFLKVRLSADDNEETVNKRLFRENGHPASVCAGFPITTNPIPMTEPLLEYRHEILFGLKDGEPFFKSKTLANPLPQFRNVEKANALLKYNRDSESSI